MAAQYLSDYSVAAKTAVKNALKTLVDAHATLPGYMTIHDAADVELSRCDFTDPCGTVDGSGDLIFDFDGRDDAAAATGTASYATIRDGAGTAISSLPCEVGNTSAPVVGKIYLSSLTITAGAPVEYLSFKI